MARPGRGARGAGARGVAVGLGPGHWLSEAEQPGGLGRGAGAAATLGDPWRHRGGPVGLQGSSR